MPRAPQASDNQLVTQLRSDYSQFTFAPGSVDRWDAHGTIYYTATTSDCSLLHELAHALLGHADYLLDIDLIRMERAAWDYARNTLAPKFGITIARADAEDALDTYRDWLHNRSLCPDCHLSGLQSSNGDYLCVACGLTWHANAAKTCALRRFRHHQTAGTK